MERGRLEVILEAKNRARQAMRQFGGDVRRAMRDAQRHAREAGRAMRTAGEDAQRFGRGGRVLGTGLQWLGTAAIRPLLALFSLLMSAVLGVVGAFGGLARAALDLGRAILTHVIDAARRAIAVLGRLAIIAGTALALAFTVSAAKAASFEQQMRNVNTIVRASEGEWRHYRAQVLALSTEVPQTADVLARALYNIASAGFKGGEGLRVLRSAAYAAVAGLAETDESVKAITGVLNAYGWAAGEAQRVSDVLFKTVERGVVTFPELAETIGMVVSTAASAQVPFEELAAAFMTMTRASINARVTTTALNRIILSFLSPSDKLRAALQGIGIDSAGAFIQVHGLGQAVQALNAIAEGNPAILAEIGLELRALRAAMALVREEGRVFAEDIAAAYEAAGATQSAYREQSKALRVQWDLMKSSIASLAITLGDIFLPAIAKAVQAVGRIATRIKEWVDAHPELQQHIQRLGDVVDAVMTAAEQRIGNWLEWFDENWASVWDAAAAKMHAASGWIAERIGNVVGAVSELWKSRGLIWEWAREGARAVAAFAAQLPDLVLEGIEKATIHIERFFDRLAEATEFTPFRATYRWAAERAHEAMRQVRGPAQAARGALAEWPERAATRIEEMRRGSGLGGRAWRAAQQRGIEYRAAWEAWQEQFAAAPSEMPEAAGIRQIGPGVWEFPAVAPRREAMPPPETAETAYQAAAGYTAAENAAWYASRAELAQLLGEEGAALRELAAAIGYQKEVLEQSRALFRAEGTQDTVDAFKEAVQALNALYAQAGGLLGFREGAAAPQFARLPARERGQGGSTVVVNFQFDQVNSKDELRRLVDAALDRMWDEQLAVEETYSNW